MTPRYRQNRNATLERLLDDPLLRFISPTPASAGLHYIQPTNSQKHIAAYATHARAMSRSQQADNAAAIGGVHFTERHALIAWAGRAGYGKGNGRGGVPNLLGLMVYAVAKDCNEPLLCTGKDFITADTVLHPASRLW